KWAARFTKTELVEEAQRRHFPASPVSTPLDLIDDPQLIARGFLKEIDHPEFGRIKFPEGAIASLVGTELTPAPRLGEHSTRVLPPRAYSACDREALIAAGVDYWLRDPLLSHNGRLVGLADSGVPPCLSLQAQRKI